MPDQIRPMGELITEEEQRIRAASQRQQDETDILDALLLARQSIDVSLIRTSQKATERWALVARKLDVAIAASRRILTQI